MITIPATEVWQKSKQLFEYCELSKTAQVHAMNQMQETNREVLNLKYYTRDGQPYIDKSKI